VSAHIGIDLGGTHLRGVVLDEATGSIAEELLAVGQDRAPEAVADRLAELVGRLLAAEGAAEGAEIAGVGIGVAAWLNGQTGVVHNAPNLGWRDVPLRDLLASRLDLPFRLVNDLTAITYGEWKMGAARGATNLLCVFVGSGLGAGLVLGGQLHEGATGIAGELGHITVEPDGRPCNCGRRGCLEAYVGGHYLEERVREAAAAGGHAGALQAAGGQVEDITCTALEVAWRNGDPDARALYEEAARWLAIGLGTAIQVLNPDTLVLGGGVMGACPGYRSLALEALHQDCPSAMLHPCHLVPPKLGRLSGAMGAALLAREL
jgi:glucokinase